jgi:hypothetical protein
VHVIRTGREWSLEKPPPNSSVLFWSAPSFMKNSLVGPDYWTLNVGCQPIFAWFPLLFCRESPQNFCAQALSRLFDWRSAQVILGSRKKHINPNEHTVLIIEQLWMFSVQGIIMKTYNGLPELTQTNRTEINERSIRGRLIERLDGRLVLVASLSHRNGSVFLMICDGEPAWSFRHPLNSLIIVFVCVVPDVWSEVVERRVRKLVSFYQTIIIAQKQN